MITQIRKNKITQIEVQAQIKESLESNLKNHCNQSGA
jgi:hypothetical protein